MTSFKILFAAAALSLSALGAHAQPPADGHARHAQRASHVKHHHHHAKKHHARHVRRASHAPAHR